MSKDYFEGHSSAEAKPHLSGITEELGLLQSEGIHQYDVKGMSHLRDQVPQTFARALAAHCGLYPGEVIPVYVGTDGVKHAFIVDTSRRAGAIKQTAELLEEAEIKADRLIQNLDL